MKSYVRRSSGRYGGSRLPALLALLVLGSACVLAYRHFFQRQGEAAISLIPADATFVVTLDLKPSPAQVSAFQRIQAAQQAEQLGAELDRYMTYALADSPLARDLHPYITTSMAMAGLKPAHGSPASDTDWIGLCAVRDPQRVRDVLARDAQRGTQNGMEYYCRANAGDKTAMAVMDDYLVVGGNADALARVVRVQHGDQPAINTVADYQRARQALPADANLMLFFPPDTVRQITASLTSRNSNANAPVTPWVVVGMAIRPGGIETFVQAPFDAPPGSDLDHIAPLDPRLLGRLPSGAYGLAAISQPSKYWSYLLRAAGSAAPLFGGNGRITSDAMNESIAKFERETGMSVPDDILPAFHGDALLAIYPPAAGRPGAEGLIVLDDANDANPAALADKVRTYIERQSASGGQNPVRFTSRSVDGATIWTLDTDTQRQLSQTLSQSANGSDSADGQRNPLRDMWDGKTVVYAQAGHGLLIASSQRMMDRALAAYLHGADGLAQDAAYAAMARQMPAGVHSLLMVDLPTIMEALRPTLTNSMAHSGDGLTPDDVIRLFGQNTGVIGTQRYDGRTLQEYFFIPLDYARAIHLICAARRASENHNTASGPVTASLNGSRMWPFQLSGRDNP